MDDKLYAIGGLNCQEDEVLDSVEVFDPSTGLWSSLPPMRAAREGHAAVAIDSKLYVIGGWDMASTEVFDPKSGEWTQVVDGQLSRDSHSAAVVDSKLYVFGGCHDDDLVGNPTEVFDPRTGKWEILTQLMLNDFSRAFATAVGIIDRTFV
eukprot:gnl/MRDRNA2_/MRDRNA2_224738_c0_seq1.p1 gnl/MRDRNA2_/MRDRNA2_224738_c0~~gnl/MRDRNA2_/MRDRNA2_224738_c0_seq1.p1  ORF type:complete len:176 (+),score=26.52 gnl/MRDRNA2_/MRDRNA2_224738_c0_seq1:77-529(+)